MAMQDLFPGKRFKSKMLSRNTLENHEWAGALQRKFLRIAESVNTTSPELAEVFFAIADRVFSTQTSTASCIGAIAKIRRVSGALNTEDVHDKVDARIRRIDLLCAAHEVILETIVRLCLNILRNHNEIATLFILEQEYPALVMGAIIDCGQVFEPILGQRERDLAQPLFDQLVETRKFSTFLAWSPRFVVDVQSKMELQVD